MPGPSPSSVAIENALPSVHADCSACTTASGGVKRQGNNSNALAVVDGGGLCSACDHTSECAQPTGHGHTCAQTCMHRCTQAHTSPHPHPPPPTHTPATAMRDASPSRLSSGASTTRRRLPDVACTKRSKRGSKLVCQKRGSRLVCYKRGTKLVCGGHCVRLGWVGCSRVAPPVPASSPTPFHAPCTPPFPLTPLPSTEPPTIPPITHTNTHTHTHSVRPYLQQRVEIVRGVRAIRQSAGPQYRVRQT